MTDAISSSVPWSSVDSTIAEIDAKSRKRRSFKETELVVGPFGMFQLDSLDSSHASVPASAEHASNAQAITPLQQPDLLETVQNSSVTSPFDSTLNRSPDVFELMGDGDGFLGWTDLFGLDLETPAASQQVPTLGLSWIQDSHGEFGIDLQLDSEVSVPTNRLDHITLAQSLSPSITTIDLNSPDVYTLLKHFGKSVISNMTSIPTVGKSPWGTMNHATAVHTLAEATYLEHPDIKRANLANLYIILAISAYAIGSTSQETNHSSEYWKGFSSIAAAKAKSYLQRSLEVETKGPGSAKYKEQLMALQATMAYAVSFKFPNHK